MIGAPRFYAEGFGSPAVALEELLAERLPRPLRALTRKSALTRGIALGVLARRGCRVAVIRRQRGSLPALLVAGLPPASRSIFVLELIRRPRPRAAGRRALWWLWWRLVERPALRRGMAAAQVMTAWEHDEYAAHYALDSARIHHVAWALCETGRSEPAPIRGAAGIVFSSGRTATDWETLFAAADESGWRLVVVCSRKDLARVGALAAKVGAEVHSELPWAEHDRLLRGADVCAIALTDRGLSSGHARLMSAVEAGVPVVATSVRSLEGYTVPGETAIVVEPGDPVRLRDAIDGLLADPDLRLALRDAARERASRWTYAAYFSRLRSLIEQPRRDDQAGG